MLKKILRTETSFSVRSISPSRWKPYAKKKILRTETSFSVRSISLSRWKPYAKKNPKDRNLILDSVNTTEQAETLC